MSVRTPKALNDLAGNPSGRRRAPEPLPVAAGLTPPEDLTLNGLVFWTRHAPELSRLGLLTVCDVVAFAACCEAWAFMIAAKNEMTVSGEIKVTAMDGHNQTEKKHPAFTVYKQAEASYLAWAKQFGLTPGARVGLPAPLEDPGNNADLYD